MNRFDTKKAVYQGKQGIFDFSQLVNSKRTASDNSGQFMNLRNQLN